MKLLLDQNLSHLLVAPLSAEFPDSLHVRQVGLQSASDADVWKYAAQHELTIVSKDSDFQQRALVFGPPPKVIWLRIGNCSTADVLRMLLNRTADIRAFEADQAASFLALA